MNAALKSDWPTDHAIKDIFSLHLQKGTETQQAVLALINALIQKSPPHMKKHYCSSVTNRQSRSMIFNNVVIQLCEVSTRQTSIACFFIYFFNISAPHSTCLKGLVEVAWVFMDCIVILVRVLSKCAMKGNYTHKNLVILHCGLEKLLE